MSDDNSSSDGWQLFHLDELATETVRPGFTRTALRAEGALTTINWLEPGYQSTGQHSHSFDQISYVLAGTMRFFLGDRVVDVAAPGALYIPGDLPHGGEPVGDERVLNIDVYAPPRADYLRLCVHQTGFSSEES
jgi:mannose-6-phosphate isomerase-like protein (cupin superfamily)